MPQFDFEHVMARAPEIQTIIDRDFPPDMHPYRILERAILDHVGPSCTVLEVGCGGRASNLLQLKGRAKTLIGIDLIPFELTDSELLLVNADVCDYASGSKRFGRSIVLAQRHGTHQERQRGLFGDQSNSKTRW